MLYIKAPEWAHEKEVRIHAYLPDEENQYWYRPQLDEQCFVSIYLGVSIAKDKKKLSEESLSLGAFAPLFKANLPAF